MIDAQAATGRERLDLADWRRRIADLYTTIRAEAARNPEAAWRRWRVTREALYRTHPQSPVPSHRRAAFTAAHWPYDPELRFEVSLQGDDLEAVANDSGDDASFVPALTEPVFGGLTLALPISTGGEATFTRIGRIAVPFSDGVRELGVFWMAGYAGGLFLPFRDGTNGHETYGAGRYLLDTAKSADLGGDLTSGTLIVDFNFAFHPSCAFDPRWSCPLAPPGNHLDLRVEAGERLA